MTDTFENDSKAFSDFLAGDLKYEISPKIAIHDYRSDHQGRGVIASEDIEEDEVLFKIPRSSFLSVENDPDFIKQVPEAKKLNSWLQLILYMMKAGSMTKWKPYFDVLPTQLDSLMMWTDDELEGLKGSMIVKKIGKAGAEEDYQEKLKPIIDAHPEYFKDCDTSLESFHRMGGLIMAYSFDAPDSFSEDEEDDEDIEHDDLYNEGLVKAMVPLADTLNAHTRFCNANLIAEDDGGFSMTAIQPIKKGEQVYNTYGELPNCDFLRRYGYVENEGTEFDIVEFSMDEISDFYANKASKDLIEEATDLLEDWQGEYEIMDEYFVVGKTGEIEFDLACFISFLELITKDTSLLSKLKQDKSLRKQVVKQLWKKSNQGLLIDDAVKSLTELVESKKKTYGEKSDKTHKHKMASIVLEGELEILDNIVKRLPETTTYVTDDILTKKRASDAPSGDAKRKK
ncbi:hypothetical protein B0I72DRAFT_143262 [Yarrowia lipolytica]|jgi:SET domain-containing protein 6|uniref:Ribosomal lysine N-methyltransferase 4 n=2 Tax=Yarrowia lipolytica TaxID=4952 RepID=Q6C037_YARLI|nr:YALI0F28061p [Yarrowia lipolytica CLIB122]AOW07817.1 hypothetical protein YALI1_F35746g [Yarrowia lipolytica]KAB8280515.1 hypothetical protein BKA91DRAFT_141763 [Yarrowia lipolytica]KAE8169208.1 hypothetical protein BKA90DRAFT_143021 [Yarrowia lipolytica]KAJ8055137.1 hypothetical protein LXG23DRAFT_18378 [Yarrowia lipolytica]QNP99631.1 Ribosomal lysine N-methyltransferase 4 [Yarrowia lipolytica]|eukprot:XP_505975.1 YALI0F28061p [Yarrowia lipolytica CLIB122]